MTRRSKPKDRRATSTAELRNGLRNGDGDEPFMPCDVTFQPKASIVAGEPRPVIEFLPMDDDDGWAVRFTLAEAAALVGNLTAFILEHSNHEKRQRSA